MKFEQAWLEMSERIEGKGAEEGKTPVIEIRFCNDVADDGTATIVCPRFFRYPEETKDDIERAWNTFCKGNPEERTDSITQINVLCKKTA